MKINSLAPPKNVDTIDVKYVPFDTLEVGVIYTRWHLSDNNPKFRGVGKITKLDRVDKIFWWDGHAFSYNVIKELWGLRYYQD